MPIQLSYSAADKYNLSPRMYYFHYIRNLRSQTTGSALVFGSAVDAGLSAMLLGKEDPYQAFLAAWDYQKLLGREVSLRNSDKIKYSKKDFDEDILTDEDKLDLEQYNPAWVSLRRKGLIILDAYREQIMPRIKEVLQVQSNVSLTNEEGDTFIGYVDLICRWEDDRIVLFDNKTTSSKYNNEMVRASGQLATYKEATTIKIDAVGYIAIPKDIRKKKKPAVEIGVFIDDVSEEVMAQTFQKYDVALRGIKVGDFPCHSPNCDTIFGPCMYKNLCKSGSYEGLVEVIKEKPSCGGCCSPVLNQQLSGGKPDA